MKLNKLLHSFWRKLVYFVGDIRRLNCFPWVTWDVHQHDISFEEALEALKYTDAGYVGLHRDKGFLSNLTIPGMFKHAFFFLDKEMVVEAISEGVVKRHALYPVVSDYVIILKPKDVTSEETQRAVNKANSIVGCQYDVDFQFDIENEVRLFEQEDKDSIKENLVKWDGGFSCTETCQFCWYHLKDKLRLYRSKHMGKMAIIADDFINNGFEIVWLSSNVTVDAAIKMKLSEQGIEMIKEYWEKL